MVRNSLNAHEFEFEGEKNDLPSQTIPDQSMGIREILQKFAQGIPLDQHIGTYEDVEIDDEFLPDPRTLDLAERQQYKELVQEELNQLRSKAEPAEPVGLTKTETEG